LLELYGGGVEFGDPAIGSEKVEIILPVSSADVKISIKKCFPTTKFHPHTYIPQVPF
jgi:hypothetical protein